MGNTWKAMTLLSTLAALVIIVYSAEEDFEPEYREVRPRRFDTATTSYEQPWRMVDMEPVATPSTRHDWGLSSQEEPPKRRRPGRKRKRRPPPTSEEDLIPQERLVYHTEYRPHQHESSNTHADIVRRRRKQFDSRQQEYPNSWIDQTVDADRPLLRKRGNKRKRPLVEDSWPELSEFNGFRPNDNTKEYKDHTYTQPVESTKNDDSPSYDTSDQINIKNDDTIIKRDSDERHQSDYIKYEGDNHNTQILHPADDSDFSDNKKDEDKSLSEFSLEIQPTDDIIDAQEKLSEKAVSTINETEKAKNMDDTLDPQTLKEILKKSNGKSLSEILQQHNLTLVDLLHGKEKAISILIEDPPQNSSEVLKDPLSKYSKVSNENIGVNNDVAVPKQNRRYRNRNVELKPKASVRNTVIIKSLNNDQTVPSTEKLDVPETVTENTTMKPIQHTEVEIVNHTENSSKQLTNNEDDFEITTTTLKPSLRRRFPVGSRRKLRMRPMNNTTYKSQLNRDLIALTSRRYQLSRNTSRSREWKDVMPTSVKVHRNNEIKVNSEINLANQIITTTAVPDETTIQITFEDTKLSTVSDFTESDPSTTNFQSDTSTETVQTTTTIDTTVTENIPSTSITDAFTDSSTTTTTTTTTTTEKPVEKSVLRPVVKASDLRRQAFNNRLKRKRLKQKTTTESNPEYPMKNIFGMANLVSASEFIAKVQPRTTINDEELDFTTLEDFITTESSVYKQTKIKTSKMPKNPISITHSTLPAQDVEETAKIELEEILNDTLTSARLSKILMERNMTIEELVEHRERGSSHIHLADIFHNASREPNPPEPFLSKSLIEPISKETYPLRALLEANLHDPTAKATPLEQNPTYLNNINIPVVMDFGNNVNENGENKGIMSLFDNFTKIISTDTNFKSQPIEISSQYTQDNSNHKYETSRESRTLNNDKDLVTWKEIIAIMHRGQKNDTNEVAELTTKEISPALVLKKMVLDDSDDDDNDGMIISNDLHHLNDFESHISSLSEEKIPYNLREKTELPQIHGTPNNTSNSAKSVTVATASIIGLAMVLFLLTYVTFKWKQQRSLFREKESLRRDRIPTPVFENRKGHKIHSSTRSKSPMISSSNIYTIDTSDLRNGNDSPEYMWDSLRKPFQ